MVVVLYREVVSNKQRVLQLEGTLNSYRKSVLVAKEKLSKGTILTEENTYREIRFSDVAEEDFITEAELQNMVVQDIEEGTCLTKNMVSTNKKEVREIYVTEAELPEHISAGRRLDVRIRYGNAEDYVVLADKILLQRGIGDGMVLGLTEEEILLLASAIADCEQFEGTKLYAVGYPQYKQLETKFVNYPAKKEILVLLGRERTEGESRSALEVRLMQKQ